MTDKVKGLLVDDVEENLRALEAALATMTHDMRTPLSVVHTTTSMLLNPKYQLSPEQVREQLERIRRNAELMNRMMGDLADMATLRSGKLSINVKPVVVNEVLGEAVTAFEKPASENGQVLRYDGSTADLRADADRARLLQLFQNLLGNALKASKVGDTIGVTLRARGNLAQIEIVDTGPGITPDELPHIFDPYYPVGTQHQKSGTGLALHIAKGIVDAHGGTIRCTSGSDGTTFSITLPLSA